MKKLYRMIILSATLLCLPLAASAQSMEDKIRSLEATVEQLQETLLKMRAEMAKDKQASASDKGGVVRSDGEDVTLSTTGGGFKLKSSNGNSFQLGGRLMWDYDNWDYDGDNDVIGDGSDSEWRRTRLTAKGTVKKDWSYGFTINITDEKDQADVNTAYIKYSGFKPISLTVGKFKEPFGLERLTSSKWISTIERSMLWDLIDEGHGQPKTGGFMISGAHAEMGNLNWALGVFDDDQKDDDGDINPAFTGRIAVAPRLSDDSFMHLGLAFSERERDGKSYGGETDFGVHTLPSDEALSLENAGVDFSGDDISQWGLEGAFVTGPFSIQAEYVDLEIDGSTDGSKNYSDLEGDGYYIQGAWTLTGEQRSYKTNGAYFDKIKPKGAMGAWELVARYEEINLEYDGYVENNTTNDAIDFDAEKMLLGVNWYANNNVKFMLNYLDADTNYQNIDGDAISFRAQYAF